ncbi:hypothetical protein LCGC14_2081430 [marine sediment metagenome]|uniref:Uncharacterized protein n=1 Tax=marine sediment metagenome TaxID=412755 RepID=A0A0F9EFF3_9ZZZZ
MTTHTPGPWQADDDLRINRVTSSGRFIPICDVLRPEDIPGRILHYADEPEANARLIAAAPAMLDALEALLSHFDNFTDESRHGWGNQEDAYYCLAKHAQDSWKKARAAIDAAKGE